MKAARGAAVALLAAPVISLIVSLYAQNGLFFWDAKTIPCGIASFLQTGNPNAYLDPHYSGACAGFGYEYMQPPAFTAVLAAAARLLGLDVISAAYSLLYALALIVLMRAARAYGKDWTDVLFFATLFACGVFVFEAGTGNIAVAFTGLLCGLITTRQKALWTILLCVVAASLKPQFALYLLVPLFAGGHWLAVSAGAAAISVAYVLDALLQPTQFERWLNLVIPIVYGEPHFGLMRLMQWMGLGAGDWAAQGIAYLAWCAAIIVLLWRQRSKLGTETDRAYAALLAVTLMQPRLKEYDAVVLIPLFFWLLSRSTATDKGWLTRIVIGLAFAAPALWWWERKASLLASGLPSITQIADPRWMIETQGVFVALSALVMFIYLIKTPAGGRLSEPD